MLRARSAPSDVALFLLWTWRHQGVPPNSSPASLALGDRWYVSSRWAPVTYSTTSSSSSPAALIRQPAAAGCRGRGPASTSRRRRLAARGPGGIRARRAFPGERIGSQLPAPPANERIEDLPQSLSPRPETAEARQGEMPPRTDVSGEPAALRPRDGRGERRSVPGGWIGTSRARSGAVGPEALPWRASRPRSTNMRNRLDRVVMDASAPTRRTACGARPEARHAPSAGASLCAGCAGGEGRRSRASA